MPLTHRDYAALSADAYEDHKVGRRAPGQEEVVPLNGHNYKVLEHVNNRQNGYQGTIYQREDTGEIIVSHRGTEEILQDAVLADGGMVLARYNLQANDAIALTQRAVALSKHIGENEGRAPEVSVTGHSLGGALAQVTATGDYLARMDTDGDGRVSVEEYVQWMLYAFDRMDRNGDGVPCEKLCLPSGR